VGKHVQNKSKLKKGLTIQLILYILLSSMFITVLITALQLNIDYKRDVRLIETRIQQIEKSYLPAIIYNLWVENTSQVKVQLQGILQLPDLQYLEVRRSEDDSIINAGEPKSKQTLTRELPLLPKLYFLLLKYAGTHFPESSQVFAYMQTIFPHGSYFTLSCATFSRNNCTGMPHASPWGRC